MLLAQHPSELAFIRARCGSPTRRRGSSGGSRPSRAATPRCCGSTAPAAAAASPLRVGPTEYWAFTSDQGRDAPLREAKLREHAGDAWAAITRPRPAHAAAPPREPATRSDGMTAHPHALGRAPRIARPATDRAADAADRSRPHAPAAAAPLLAVCGALRRRRGEHAQLPARALRRRARPTGHVLVCDTGGPTGGLAAPAGVESRARCARPPRSVARGVPLADALYAVDPHAGDRGRELRVIATGPRLAAAGDPTALRRRCSRGPAPATRHALVVVDCGTLQRAPDRLALRAASHVAWVAARDRRGGRAAPSACSTPLPALLGARELIVARRADATTAGSATRARARSPSARRAPLVLLPHLADARPAAGRALDARAGQPAGHLRGARAMTARARRRTRARWPSPRR